VASYDEDTTTMGVEAARLALRGLPAAPEVSSIWFSSAAPAYLDKTNATTLHAALLLDPSTTAYDANGSVRSALGALRAGFSLPGVALVVASDLRIGLPGGSEEATAGDGAACLVIGDDGVCPVLAEVIGWSSVTEEFVDRWRSPGDPRSKVWEERFGEQRYLPLAEQAWRTALKEAGMQPAQVSKLVVSGLHERAARATAGRMGVPSERLVDNLVSSVGNSGVAQPAVLLVSALEDAGPDQIIAVVVLADGVEVLLLRTTQSLGDHRPARALRDQLASGRELPYGKYLAWRGLLPVEPPRRPEPARTSAAAASRSAGWKFGFVASESSDGRIHLPPAPLDRISHPMAASEGTIATFTVDRLVYSPSPPVIFAVVDFDRGGRLPVELTDVDPSDVTIGKRVEMTFRRISTADGIHNYFWKARLIRTPPQP
jgi:3-hydroxy-3-methylglutaryl CoA synthase